MNDSNLKSIIITDLTRMRGDRVCIFGYDGDLNPIRPSLRGGIHEQHLYIDGDLLIRPSAHIQFSFTNRISNPPHIEDYYINRNYKPVFKRFFSPIEMKILLEKTLSNSVSEIFGAEVHENRYINPGEGKRSLGTIQPENIHFVRIGQYDNGNPLYRMEFTDSTGTIFNFPITDCAFRNYCNQIYHKEKDYYNTNRSIQENLSDKNIFLRLGITRAFENKLWIQISAIYAYP